MHYEVRLLKLYCFWIIILSPVILFGCHKEYLNFSWITPLLFIRNFFFVSQFGASWFFGALIVGVPIVYVLTKVFNDKLVWVIPFIVYVYVFMKIDDKAIFDWYEANITPPKLSFPAGLLWITIGYLLSGNILDRLMRTCPVLLSTLLFVLSFVLGSIFNDYDYLFRIISVLSLIFIAYHIKVDNISVCRRLRTYSIHFFCIHYSVMWVLELRVLNHISFIHEQRLVLYVATILICWAASETIIRLRDHKGWQWLRWSS